MLFSVAFNIKLFVSYESNVELTFQTQDNHRFLYCNRKSCNKYYYAYNEPSRIFSHLVMITYFAET